MCTNSCNYTHSCYICLLRQILYCISQLNSTLQTYHDDLTRTSVFFQAYTNYVFHCNILLVDTAPFCKWGKQGTQESQTLSKPCSQVLADSGMESMSPDSLVPLLWSPDNTPFLWNRLFWLKTDGVHFWHSVLTILKCSEWICAYIIPIYVYMYIHAYYIYAYRNRYELRTY